MAGTRRLQPGVSRLTQGVAAPAATGRVGSSIPGSLCLEEEAQFVGRRQRPIEQLLKRSKCSVIDREKCLIEQHVLCLAARSVEHELRPAAAQPFSGLVDQIALPRLGTDIDAHSIAGICMGHRYTPVLHRYVDKVV